VGQWPAARGEMMAGGPGLGDMLRSWSGDWWGGSLRLVRARRRHAEAGVKRWRRVAVAGTGRSWAGAGDALEVGSVDVRARCGGGQASGAWEDAVVAGRAEE
jgi:hypothetical protein